MKKDGQWVLQSVREAPYTAPGNHSANWSRGGSFAGGGWNRYGYGSVTGAHGNTYARGYVGSGYYGGGFRGGYVSGPYGSAYAGGVYRRPFW